MHDLTDGADDCFRICLPTDAKEKEMANYTLEDAPVLVVMGVSGSGKSTIASLLAGQLGWDMEEGDDLHPSENVQKMSAGHPLTDDDRWPWLDTVASWITEHALAGKPGVITCSALKRSYRDKLRGNNVIFVHLSGAEDEIQQRLTARLDHYMPASLLHSQLSALEAPGPDENTLIVDVGRQPGVQVTDVLRRLQMLPTWPTPDQH
jgi:gluconokinase